MARITVEDCLREQNNRFALVQLAAKRTKQLLSGSKLLISEAKGNKSVVNSLREIAAGAVRLKTEEDMQKERELALKQREAELALAAEQAEADAKDAALSNGGSVTVVQSLSSTASLEERNEPVSTGPAEVIVEELEDDEESELVDEDEE
ncbi:MAG: DNA-directed RNA polymerase subunit omega [Bdellovibrionales bacterium]|nr:DNA-directed RNA polymerase subunit omega [Bdellovibrionales bacterium]